MISVAAIGEVLSRDLPPRQDTRGRSPAAVAMILRPTEQGPKVLFIERAPHRDDPWSGNLAFPGGRLDPEDADLRAAAERETREEVGVDLKAAQLLGRLDDITGAYLPIRVSCFVYLLKSEVTTVPNHEVARVLWFPFAELCAPERHTRAELFWHGQPRQVHGIRIADDVPLLWGITYRLVVQLLDRLGLVDPGLTRIEDD